MTRSALSLWILFFTSAALAKPICLVASNPQVITIKELEGRERHEKAKEAQAIWESQSITHDGDTMPPNIKLYAQSKHLRFST